MTEIPQDIVIFRRWNDTGDIVAVFPERPADDEGRYCQSYDEMGQQVAIEYDSIFEETVPASKAEYGRLAHELTMLGYRLQPMTEATAPMHERRREAARNTQGNHHADL